MWAAGMHANPVAQAVGVRIHLHAKLHFWKQWACPPEWSCAHMHTTIPSPLPTSRKFRTAAIDYHITDNLFISQEKLNQNFLLGPHSELMTTIKCFKSIWDSRYFTIFLINPLLVKRTIVCKTTNGRRKQCRNGEEGLFTYWTTHAGVGSLFQRYFVILTETHNNHRRAKKQLK